MAKTGPQKYPGASTAYWHQSRYGGTAMESNVVVWHTTEGTSVPSYGGGASAPNFTMLPDFANKRLKVYQHFDFDVSSRALVNRSGGVETNTLNVVQVEIVGTCDPATHKKWGSTPHLYTPDLPGWVIRDLAAFARWAHDQHGVPLTSDVTFKAYPSSYGASSVRMSHSKWNRYRGHCGHQHVPENAHGDPGAFPMAAILARASGQTTPEQESSMDLHTKVALNEWISRRWPNDKGLADGQISVKTALGSGYAHSRRAAEASEAVLAKLDAQQAVLDKLVDAVAAGPGADLEALKQEIRTAIESVSVRLDVEG